jgi:hypothetical protein
MNNLHVSQATLVATSAIATLLTLASGALGTSAAAPGPQGARYVAGKTPEAMPSQSATYSNHFKDLRYGVEYDVSVNAGATTRWISEGNPLFAVGDLVRPVSIAGVATWNEQVISSTHLQYWEKLDSKEGLGSSVDVLGTIYSKEPGVTPRSTLSLDIRPTEDWGKFRAQAGLLVSVKVEPLQEPKSDDAGHAPSEKPK